MGLLVWVCSMLFLRTVAGWGADPYVRSKKGAIGLATSPPKPPIMPELSMYTQLTTLSKAASYPSSWDQPTSHRNQLGFFHLGMRGQYFLLQPSGGFLWTRGCYSRLLPTAKPAGLSPSSPRPLAGRPSDRIASLSTIANIPLQASFFFRLATTIKYAWSGSAPSKKKATSDEKCGQLILGTSFIPQSHWQLLSFIDFCQKNTRVDNGYFVQGWTVSPEFKHQSTGPGIGLLIPINLSSATKKETLLGLKIQKTHHRFSYPPEDYDRLSLTSKAQLSIGAHIEVLFNAGIYQDRYLEVAIGGYPAKTFRRIGHGHCSSLWICDLPAVTQKLCLFLNEWRNSERGLSRKNDSAWESGVVWTWNFSYIPESRAVEFLRQTDDPFRKRAIRSEFY